MPEYKTITGKIVEFSATSYIELRESTTSLAGVSNVIYFTVEFNSIELGGKSSINRMSLCVCENLRFPGPFKNMRKFLIVGFTTGCFCSVMYDDSREVFVLKVDGKHHRTKVAVSISLYRNNPFLNLQTNRPPQHLNIPAPQRPQHTHNRIPRPQNLLPSISQPLSTNLLIQPPPPPPPNQNTTNNMNNK